MLGLLIIAHAPLASSLRAVALHAFPDCARELQALDVWPNMESAEIEAQARALLKQLSSRQVLVFTDVFGATPCNVAQRLADGHDVKVIAGVNVPMLWRSLCYGNEPLEAVAARAIAGATQGVMQVAATRPQNQAQKRGDDQAHDHHQQ